MAFKSLQRRYPLHYDQWRWERRTPGDEVREEPPVRLSEYLPDSMEGSLRRGMSRSGSIATLTSHIPEIEVPQRAQESEQEPPQEPGGWMIRGSLREGLYGGAGSEVESLTGFDLPVDGHRRYGDVRVG